jgi:hypothetical protein
VSVAVSNACSRSSMANMGGTAVSQVQRSAPMARMYSASRNCGSSTIVAPAASASCASAKPFM